MILTPNRRSRRARAAASAARDRVNALYNSAGNLTAAERRAALAAARTVRDSAETREAWTHNHQLARFARFVQRDLRAVCREPRSLSHYEATAALYRVALGGAL